MADDFFRVPASASFWTGPRDPQAQARQSERDREAGVRVPNIVRAEWQRLSGPEDIDPIADPAAAADALEAMYGTLEDLPGFNNADEYAQAGSEYASGKADPVDAYRRAQFIMPESRFEYMQEGPGRIVDVLRGLKPVEGDGRDDAARRSEALTYWDQSNNARTTRDDYSNPNYQRFSDFNQGAAALMANPSSPVARALDTMSLTSRAILNRAESDSSAQALDQAGQRRGLFHHSIVTPEIEVLDLQPSALAGLSQEDRDRAYASRKALLQGLHRDIQPTPVLNFANTAYHKLQDSFGNPSGPKANVSPGVADTVGVIVDAFDPSLAAGATVGMGGKLLAGQSVGRALVHEGIEQAVPEVAFGGGIGGVTGVGGDGSYYDYWTKGAESGPNKGAERERAAAVTAGLLRESPQDIWASRMKATPYGQGGSRYRSPSESYPAAGR